MNTLGWQIGAFLIGASALIIAVYIGKLLNTTNKVVEKVYKIIDYNEKDINKLSREENKSNLFSSIGDYAIGNQSAMTLGTISALKEEYNRKEIFQVLNLLKGSTDNNILLYDNPKSNRDSIVYIGHNRTFIALNASKDLNSSKILNILSFSSLV